MRVNVHSRTLMRMMVDRRSGGTRFGDGSSASGRVPVSSASAARNGSRIARVDDAYTKVRLRSSRFGGSDRRRSYRRGSRASLFDGVEVARVRRMDEARCTRGRGGRRICHTGQTHWCRGRSSSRSRSSACVGVIERTRGRRIVRRVCRATAIRSEGWSRRCSSAGCMGA